MSLVTTVTSVRYCVKTRVSTKAAQKKTEAVFMAAIKIGGARSVTIHAHSTVKILYADNIMELVWSVVRGI